LNMKMKSRRVTKSPQNLTQNSDHARPSQTLVPDRKAAAQQAF
jgi:hypothetical protein